MIKLIDAKGEEIKEPLDINKEVNNFYSNLYKAKDLKECEIEQLVTEIPKLSEEESRSLEGKIAIEEAGTALKNMKHEKAQVRMVLGQNCSNAFGSSLDHL